MLYIVFSSSYTQITNDYNMYTRVDIHNDRHITQVATYFYYNDPEYESKNKYQKTAVITQKPDKRHV